MIEDTARGGLTPVETPVDIPKSLGELCVEKGLVTTKDLEDCLKVQRELERDGKQVPRLGNCWLRRAC